MPCAPTRAVLRSAREQRKRITALEAKRRKLLSAYTGGAIALDLLKEQQEQIMSELAEAGAALAATEIHWETIDANLQMALSLATRFELAYRQASPATQRALSHALFERIEVDV